MKFRGYSEETVQYIVDNFLSMPTAQIAEYIGKSVGGVGYIARKLGLSKQVHNKWTDDEINFLKEHYIDMTSEEISKHVNHSVAAINTQRDRLGLVRAESWSDEEIEFLKCNFKNMTHFEIGEYLDRTEQAVRAKCFDLNLYKKELPWSKEEIIFLKENYKNKTAREMSYCINRTAEAIKLKAEKLGFGSKKCYYTCDYHYFDVIDTEEKAYWLGFLSADGWISLNTQSHGGVTGIELQYGDIDHLRKFNKSISGNYLITDRWRECSLSDSGKKHHMCQIRIFSLAMYNSLIKWGFSNEKSYDFHIPELKPELLKHYMRGYFDGDGCLGFTGSTPSVGFVAASYNLYMDILNLLNRLDINTRKHVEVNEYGTTIYTLKIRYINDKLNFLNYIYSDCSIYLDRKYDKYLQIINKYNQLDGLAC